MLGSGLWIAVTGREDRTFGFVIVGFLTLWIPLVAGCVIISRRKGAGSLADDYGFWIAPRSDLVMGVSAGLVCQLALVPLIYEPLRIFIDDEDLSGPARSLAASASGWRLAVLAFVVVVGAPLVEELFYRGLLQRALVRRFGTGWGVASSSVLFGATHFQPIQFPALVAFGAVVGLLAARTGRLGPGMLAHATFNGAAVVLLVLT